jgi:hypothetical protein
MFGCASAVDLGPLPAESAPAADPHPDERAGTELTLVEELQPTRPEHVQRIVELGRPVLREARRVGGSRGVSIRCGCFATGAEQLNTTVSVTPLLRRIEDGDRNVSFPRRFRECVACGSDNQTRSNSRLHAKYAVLMCARPPRATVAMAHSVDASRRDCAIAARRAAAIGRVDRTIGIEQIYVSPRRRRSSFSRVRSSTRSPRRSGRSSE